MNISLVLWMILLRIGLSCIGVILMSRLRTMLFLYMTISGRIKWNSWNTFWKSRTSKISNTNKTSKKQPESSKSYKYSKRSKWQNNFTKTTCSRTWTIQWIKTFKNMIRWIVLEMLNKMILAMETSGLSHRLIRCSKRMIVWRIKRAWGNRLMKIRFGTVYHLTQSDNSWARRKRSSKRKQRWKCCRGTSKQLMQSIKACRSILIST